MSKNFTLNAERLSQQITAFTGQRVLIVGDVMLDSYITGDVERISPEAPVPILRVEGEKMLVGGAGNVAKNIRALGGEPMLLSICGTGSNAATLRKRLEADHITYSLVPVSGRRTTVKTRVLARRQQMLRIDYEDASPLLGVGLNDFILRLKAFLPHYDVIILSDYGKGIVTPQFMQEFRDLLRKNGNRHKVFVDPKTPNFDLYQEPFILTPNAKETSEGAKLPVSTPKEIMAAGRAIFAKLHCQKLLTTLGADGMAYFENERTAWHIPTAARAVFDVTGAGDTVIATLALAYAAQCHTAQAARNAASRNEPIQVNDDAMLDACILANCAAGIVVAQVGAATATQHELREAVAEFVQELMPERWEA